MTKIVLLTLVSVFLFVGCTSSPLEEIKKECEENNQVFKISHQLNFRTGKYETIGYCN